jgi:glutathione synthase/RimK-type ligase-like ATP-grasp enzyme
VAANKTIALRNAGNTGSAGLQNTIAFATCLSRPEITADDQSLAEELAAEGYRVEACPWDDPNVDWAVYAAVVIRSTWNYHTQKEKFKAWLNELAKDQVRTFNPVTILEWNMDKRYLADLKALGIPVPELYYFPAGTKADLSVIFSTTGWTKAVIKPCVSATAHNTWVTTLATETIDSGRLNICLKKGDYIVQEFMDEIQSDGEYSLIFFSDRYSHAVKKTVSSGEFRVQEQFGGTSTPVQPDGHIIRQAQKILQTLKKFTATAPADMHSPDTRFPLRSLPKADILYARVDGTVRNGIFFLMELELIEPVLFFNNDEGAIKRFTSALLEKIPSPRPIR